VYRILFAATVLFSLLNPASAIPKPPPPLADHLRSCALHAEAMIGLLKAISVVESQLFGTPAWKRRISQMQEGLADLPSPVVARFLAGKLEPLTNEPGNQEHLTTFAAKRQTFYERMLVFSNPVEMTEALLGDATRIENMMATLPMEEHAKLRFGQPEEFEQFEAARFRLWEVHQLGSCSMMRGPALH
jgi:hypothetical protein